MCPRYALTLSAPELARHYALEPGSAIAEASRRFNVVPSLAMPIIAIAEGSRRCVAARWGLIPLWVNGMPQFKVSAINARAEGLRTSKLYAPAFKARRCLVPASGWYEWQADAGGPIPHYMTRDDAAPISFAGLWSEALLPGEPPQRSFTILTVPAVGALRQVHPRMPALIAPADHQLWLEGPYAAAGEVLRARAAGLSVQPVGDAVADIRKDDAGLILPLEAPRLTGTS